MLRLPPLYPIVDCPAAADSAEAAQYAERLMRAGAGILQLRAKGLLPAEFVELTAAVLQARTALRCSAAVIVNDSVEVCRAAGADGVHLGQTDDSPLRARAVLGPSFILGLSTHNAEQFRAADVADLDYLALGPIYSSSTKSGHAPLVGLEILTSIAAASKLPLVAIGGITAENAADVYLAGAASVAVIADLRRAPNLAARMRAYEDARRSINRS